MDYAAAPLQPIAQALLTVAGSTPSLFGKGFSSVTSSVAGIYLLTLDKGLPGNAGEVVPATSPTLLPGWNIRTMVSVRGSLTNPTLANSTTITNYIVDYIDPGPDGGPQQIQLTLTDSSQTPTAPTGTDASGVEIIVFRGFSPS